MPANILAEKRDANFDEDIVNVPSPYANSKPSILAGPCLVLEHPPYVLPEVPFEIEAQMRYLD